MEVQNHGVVFEDEVIFGITGKRKSEYQNLIEGAYTSSLDIYQGYYSDINYSIKVSKNGKGIGCGDILRFNKHCRDTEFTMVVGCWKQVTPTCKRYDEIYEFYILPEHYQKIWSNINYTDLEPFVNYVKGIPPGRESQLANRRVWKNERQSIYDRCGKGLAAIDAKIDSKNQRRVQCSMKLAEMIEAGIPYHKYTVEYKGITLPYEQTSTPRSGS